MENVIANISPNSELHIATALRRTQKVWKNEVLTWSSFLSKLARPTVTPETCAEWAKMTPSQQDNIKDVGGFVGGWLKKGRRKAGNIQNRTLITLDVDFPDKNKNLFDDAVLLWGFSFAVYSTHKYTKSNPRIRFVIPTARPVTAEEYVPIARKIANELGIDHFDDSTYQPERLMYWPSHSKDAPYFFNYQQGPLLNPDKVLNEFENWRDSTFWPTSSRETEVHKRNAKLAGNPLEKPGIIGAFNRAYPIKSAIDTFLPDVYEPTAHDDRYTFIKGSTTGGLVLYEDVFAYSNHGTDPTGGELTNAFDLVRIHKFGELDAKVKPNAPVTERPSYKKMQEFAISDNRVYAEWQKMATGNANDDFSEYTEVAEPKKEEIHWLSISKSGATVVNSYELARKVIQDYQIFSGKDLFLRYDTKTGIWKSDAETYLAGVITNQYLKKLYKNNIVKETIQGIKNILNTDQGFEDTDQNKIVLKNGVYDIETGKFSKSFDPSLHARVAYPVEYDPDAKAPIFEDYVKWLLSEEELAFLYEWIGYMFYRSYPIQKMLFIYGIGGSGKSTLINVIRNVVGTQAASSVSLEALMTKQFAPAGLYQKTANFDSDAKAQYLEDGAILKTLTGEDLTYADVKFGEPIQFRNFAKLTFTMNRLPAMRDFSGGLERRAIILKVGKKVTPEIKKKYPYKKMLNEAPGIFRNAMEGLRVLLHFGSFTESDSMRYELKKWISGNDQVGRFVEEILVKDKSAYTSVEEMYNAYTDFAEENGEKSLGKYKFGQRLEDMGYKKSRRQDNGNRTLFWEGLRVSVTDFD